MRYRYTDEQIEYLMSLNGLPRKEVARKFNEKYGTNKNPDTLANIARKHGAFIGSKDFYTEQEDSWLKENRPKYEVHELVDSFNKRFGKNRTQNGIVCRCKRIGAKPSTDGRFTKGFTPWMVGLSYEEFKAHYTDESFAKGKFKKGQRTYIDYHVGDECKRGNYTYVKISEDMNIPCKDQWQMKGRYVWEFYNGEIPDGYSIVYLDGNPDNNDISNLAIIKQAYMRVMRQFTKLDIPEIKMTAIKLCELYDSIRIATKAESGADMRGESE